MNYGVSVASAGGNLVNQETSLSSSLSRVFGNQPFNVAVTKLFGCTSVLVVSSKGVYMNHLWQGNSFEASPDVFQSSVLDVLGPGAGDNMVGLTPLAQPGESLIHQRMSPYSSSHLHRMAKLLCTPAKFKRSAMS
jgi:hypothetical protein